jgi:hypothetical protein
MVNVVMLAVHPQRMLHVILVLPDNSVLQEYLVLLAILVLPDILVLIANVFCENFQFQNSCSSVF